MSAGCAGISHALYDAGRCPRNHASLLACNVQEPKLAMQHACEGNDAWQLNDFVGPSQGAAALGVVTCLHF